MKKVYSSLKTCALSIFLLLSVSNISFGQVCGPIVENFQNTSGSTAGFTGDFVLGSTAQSSFLVKRNPVAGAIYTITTPTYRLPNNATAVGYGFTLSGTEKVARVEISIMYVSTANNQMVTVFIAQFVPTYGTGSTANVADVCRAGQLSELPGFPVGGRYRFRIELTPNTGSGANNQNITFDDFRTNGSLAQTPLPVNFIGFEARKSNGTVQLTWKVAGEENVARYEVERSDDGRNFTTIGSVARSGKDTYTYTDATSSSTAFYRVKNVDEDGKFKYSTIARIANGRSEIVLKAFPQPVQNQLTVQHPSISDRALLSITTADGRVVRNIIPAIGSMQTIVDMSSLKAGMYMIRFDAGDGSTETMKVLKQ